MSKLPFSEEVFPHKTFIMFPTQYSTCLKRIIIEIMYKLIIRSMSRNFRKNDKMDGWEIGGRIILPHPLALFNRR